MGGNFSKNLSRYLNSKNLIFNKNQEYSFIFHFIQPFHYLPVNKNLLHSSSISSPSPEWQFDIQEILTRKRRDEQQKNILFGTQSRYGRVVEVSIRQGWKFSKFLLFSIFLENSKFQNCIEFQAQNLVPVFYLYYRYIIENQKSFNTFYYSVWNNFSLVVIFLLSLDGGDGVLSNEWEWKVRKNYSIDERELILMKFISENIYKFLLWKILIFLQLFAHHKKVSIFGISMCWI